MAYRQTVWMRRSAVHSSISFGICFFPTLLRLPAPARAVAFYKRCVTILTTFLLTAHLATKSGQFDQHCFGELHNIFVLLLAAPASARSRLRPTASALHDHLTVAPSPVRPPPPLPSPSSRRRSLRRLENHRSLLS